MIYEETIKILDNLLMNRFLDNVLTTKEWEAIKNAEDVMIKTHAFSTSMVVERRNYPQVEGSVPVYTFSKPQTEITVESAIDYLQSIGWMQKHDKELTESAPSVTEFADKCRECGKALGYSLKQMTETRTENRKPGLWLWIYDDDTGSYRCSECCGKGAPNFKFCPHCGSGMMTRLHR